MENKKSTWQTLRNKFPEGEYVLIQEVSDASGVSRSRSLDYMIINLWQSRGLHITGIEQKSFRNDWQRELKNPKKQENHFKYCDYFYLLTDKENVAKLEEIPETWGWYHINEKGHFKINKPAPKLTPVTIDRSFLFAMLRRAASKEKYVHIESIEDKIQEASELRQKNNLFSRERDLKEYEELKTIVKQFEEASGIKLNTYSWNIDAKKIGETVKLITDGGLNSYINNLIKLQTVASNILDKLTQELLSVKTLNEELNINGVDKS